MKTASKDACDLLLCASLQSMIVSLSEIQTEQVSVEVSKWSRRATKIIFVHL